MMSVSQTAYSYGAFSYIVNDLQINPSHLCECYQENNDKYHTCKEGSPLHCFWIMYVLHIWRLCDISFLVKSI